MTDFALGIVIRDRWDLTRQTLDSLSFCDQPRDSYDIFLIDNGSSEENRGNLKNYLKSSTLPYKSIIFLPENSISKAWNLFLALSRHYDYRVKYDNDLVLPNTISVQQEVNPGAPNPSDYGTNPGAIPSGAPRVGVGAARAAIQRRKEMKKLKSHTAFLNHMLDFATENNVHLTSLVPVSPELTFLAMYRAVISRQWAGLPYLFGACMMISRKCFEKIGYFHEKMDRRIDMEYSQRAVKNGMNIGYHPFYGVIHTGAHETTESAELVKMKQQKSIVTEKENPIETYSNSQWENCIESIEFESAKHRFLTLA